MKDYYKVIPESVLQEQEEIRKSIIKRRNETIEKDEDYKKLYEECLKEVKELVLSEMEEGRLFLETNISYKDNVFTDLIFKAEGVSLRKADMLYSILYADYEISLDMEKGLGVTESTEKY